MEEKLIKAKGEGYALALRRVIDWLNSGKSLEEYFSVHQPAFNLIPEWAELQRAIRDFRKKK